MSVINIKQLMLYREIIAVCSEIRTKHANTLCGQNVEFLNGVPGGSDQLSSRVKYIFTKSGRPVKLDCNVKCVVSNSNL